MSLVLAKGFDGFTTKFNKGLKNTGFKITERFAGSHSYRADYSRSIKRLIHGNSSFNNITYKTYRNGFMAEMTENFFVNPTNGMLGVGWDEIKELAKQQADQIVKEAQGTAKQEVIEIEQSIVTKRKELEDLEKQIDVYKAKMESLLISQLELLKDMNKD